MLEGAQILQEHEQRIDGRVEALRLEQEAKRERGNECLAGLDSRSGVSSFGMSTAHPTSEV